MIDSVMYITDTRTLVVFITSKCIRAGSLDHYYTAVGYMLNIRLYILMIEMN